MCVCYGAYLCERVCVCVCVRVPVCLHTTDTDHGPETCYRGAYHSGLVVLDNEWVPWPGSDVLVLVLSTRLDTSREPTPPQAPNLATTDLTPDKDP